MTCLAAAFINELTPAIREYETYLAIESEDANFQTLTFESSLLVSQVRVFQEEQSKKTHMELWCVID